MKRKTLGKLASESETIMVQVHADFPIGKALKTIIADGVKAQA
jgi:hypothetical protein